MVIPRGGITKIFISFVRRGKEKGVKRILGIGLWGRNKALPLERGGLGSYGVHEG